MEKIIKLNSITKKWLTNILPFIIFIVITAELVFAISMNSYYLSLVKDKASEYTRTISVLSLSSEDDFYAAATDFVENFDYQDKIELQILDKNGNIIISTNGFSSATSNLSAEFKKAVETSSGKSTWQGKLDGQSILAQTAILPDLGYGVNGGFRWVVCMDEVNNTYYLTVAVAIFVGVFAIVLIVLSGFYFIKSIVRPVGEITSAARKIASGNLETKLIPKGQDEIAELCDAINFMASELKQAEKAKNDFISSVSHELRTPLTAIKGWGETVKMSITNEDEIVNKGVSVMLSEADRLSGLVEELLDFSRMQVGKLSMTPELINPSVPLADAINMYHELAHQQNISIDADHLFTNRLVMADKNRIKQVFINVIDNAVKYSNDGGKIVATLFEEEGCVRITVSDTGVGISQKDLNHVKEKFYKANQTVRGSGIGLAVADEIIKQHNGLLFIESAENVGTTVTIVLPTVENQPEEITEVIFPANKESL